MRHFNIEDYELMAVISSISNLERSLFNIETRINSIMATLQDIQAAVAAESTVDDSIIALLNGIVSQLKTAIANYDPVALDAIVKGIEDNTAKLQAAVTANTPAAPATPAV